MNPDRACYSIGQKINENYYFKKHTPYLDFTYLHCSNQRVTPLVNTIFQNFLISELFLARLNRCAYSLAVYGNSKIQKWPNFRTRVWEVVMKGGRGAQRQESVRQLTSADLSSSILNLHLL